MALLQSSDLPDALAVPGGMLGGKTVLDTSVLRVNVVKSTERKEYRVG